MKRIDLKVNDLQHEELKSQLFGKTLVHHVSDDNNIHIDLRLFLKKFPIRYKKICFVSPPLLTPEYINIKSAKARRYMTYTPYGIMTLTAAISEFCSDWDTSIIDLNVDALHRSIRGEPYDLDSLMKKIPLDCDAYAVTWMFASAEQPTIRVLQELMSRKKLVLIGGTQASTDCENLLKFSHAHIVVKREGETQIVRLLNCWQDKDKFTNSKPLENSIVNLAYMDEKGIRHFPNSYENPINIDIRNEYRKIDLDVYNESGSPNMWTRLPGKARKFGNVLASRGCRGACIFCQVTPFMGKGVRSRSIDDVIDEIKYLYDEHDVRHIEWVDDDLLANPKHSIALFKAISQKKMDITFSTGNGVLACSINEELAAAMGDCGFVHTGFGVETGSEKRMKTLKKPASLKNVYDTCLLFKNNQPQIWLHANFMVGYPNETYGEMMETFNYAKNLEIDWCACMVLQPLLSTPIYNDFVESNDDRVVDRFGSGKIGVASPGRDSLNKGKTFDDIFTNVVDFRYMSPDKIATKEDIQQFHIYFTVFINLLGSINLLPGGNPERIKLITEDTLKSYPFDPVSWAVNAQACKLLGDMHSYSNSRNQFIDTLKKSWYWQEFFNVYELNNVINEKLDM